MPIYPTPNEIYIYENKRFLYSWLKANNLPCAETKIFYKKAEALDYLTKTDYPIVAKYNIGASGSGVQILKNNSEAVDYVIKTFSSKGAPRRWGPNLQKGNLIKRSLNQLKDLNFLNQKLNKYAAIKQDKQTGFVLFQEFIPHEFEWRIVSIGGSYFAHKKLKLGDKASGSLLKNYDNPPLYLFDFAKSIMDKFNFTSQAIDVFECDKAKLIVNEMQCIFGQSDEYQMLVDAKPGRYVYENNSWQFEEGNFNTNESYDLRVAHIIKLLNKKAE